jgi:glucose/arabinose dehydrogenase
MRTGTAPPAPTARPRLKDGIHPSTAILLLALWLGLLFSGPASARSLRFFGNGSGDIDRVKIKIDNPAKPADVGATDFTLEWWMRAVPGENAADDVTCGANEGWITGNILFDRDVFGDGDHGDYGVSLTGGRLAFGVSVGSAGNTICGTIDVTDDVWHHVAVTRRFSDGWLRIYVDGALDAEGSGNVGSNQDVSYRDNRATTYPQSDPYLVIGAEKHDAGSAYPSYHGWIDEVRLSTSQRYTGSGFTRPFGLFTPDGSTAALYHLDEGTGDSIGDSSGGGSQGVRRFGGNPAGPEWAADGGPLEGARRVALQSVISSLTRPVAIANAGDERLFVVEADGRILAYQVTETGSFTFLDTFLDIRGRVLCCDERGLLGLAFHPNFASNGYFFVYYTRASDGDVVLARYQASAAASNTVQASTEHILLTIDHSTYGNHNGGGIAFGPEGYLYVPIGDGGGGGDPLHSGQDLGTLLGKILRLDIDVKNDPAPYYEIPPDNPFVNTQGARPEIWAWGVRNPWRIGFDRLTGDLFIADVGQNNREEVNFQPASSPGGHNYGWPRMEGTACYSPSSGCQTGTLVLPILDYSHAEGCSVIGGYRYRGSGLPTLNGAYVFGDFCSKKIWIGVQSSSGGWSRADLLTASFNISTFGEDSAGEVYVADVNGAIYRLARVPYGAIYQASGFSTTTGTTLTVPVTLTNTGSLTWDGNSLYRLAYHWYQGSTLVTWEGVRTTLPSTVPPGGSITIQAPVNAPAGVGAYTLKWDLLRQTVAWFSTQGVTPMAVPVTVTPAPPPYGATYQASSFNISAGATLTVPVTLTNTGSLTWDANSAYRLAYHWYQGASLVTWDGLRTALPSTVLSGGSLTLQAAVKAPAAPGAYTLQWDMVREVITWFSGQGVTPKAIPITVGSGPPPYGATYQASAFSTTAGATLTVPVTLTNTGSLTWDGNSLYRLAYHWYQGSTLVTWEGVRTTLPSTVLPGGSLTVQAAVKAPAAPGTYTLKWDLLRQTVAWFSGQGVATGNLTINVAP